MTDDLIEQLANQLVSAFWSGKPAIPTHQAVLLASTKKIDTELPIDVAWRAVARECLRQMQWAADRGYKAGRTSGFNAATYWPKSPLNEESTFGPLRTLAPPDWKP